MGLEAGIMGFFISDTYISPHAHHQRCHQTSCVTGHTLYIFHALHSKHMCELTDFQMPLSEIVPHYPLWTHKNSLAQEAHSIDEQ
jgi:hypothetical protein